MTQPAASNFAAIALLMVATGIGDAVFFVLPGQLVAAAAIDHYGLFGALKTEITLPRDRNALMAAGIYLARETA